MRKTKKKRNPKRKKKTNRQKKDTVINLPPIGGKEVTMDFDGDPMIQHEPLWPIVEAGKETGAFATLVKAIRDRRHPSRVTHSLFAIVRERCLTIATGFQDAPDLDAIHDGAAIRTASERDSVSYPDMEGPPAVPCLEEDVTRQDVVRASIGLIDIYCTTSYVRQPESIILDIDTAFYRSEEEQEGAARSEHSGERGYAPLHVYDVEIGAPVAIALASAAAPAGDETLPLAKSLIRRIRRHWPETQITLRGDFRFAHWQVMDLCDGLEGVDYIFGFESACLEQGIAEIRGAEEEAQQACGPDIDDTAHALCAFSHRAQSWKAPRRVVCRTRATRHEFMNSSYIQIDSRFLVTSLERSTPEDVYERKCRTRESGETLSEFHKREMKRGRLPYRSAQANQMRLVLCFATHFLVFFGQLK